MTAALRLLVLALPLVFILGADSCGPRPWTSPHEPLGRDLFASPQVDPLALSTDGSRLYVANTTSGTVSVIDTASLSVLVPRIRVGIEPSSLALRPDGSELWVSNHVSDSVSVIDTDPASPTYHEVIATIQDLDANGVTRFDEPAGIAFADDTKAYVALSSRDEIAVVDVAGRSVAPGRLPVTAQDPRALAVQGGRLYALAFESGNQSEISACGSAGAPGNWQCTFALTSLLTAGTDPNLPGTPINVVRDPDVPDRDLFVFDTATDQLVESVPGVGTLLYGMAVSSAGTVHVTNTDARNAHVDDQGSPDGNGLAAPAPDGQGQGLADLENRPFLNRVTTVSCGGASCGAPGAVSLEEPPGQPVQTPLATPYGAALSGDEQILLVTAAGSDRLASLAAGAVGPGGVLDTLDVGANPRAVVFDSPPGASGGTAWVLNTLENSVTAVAVDPSGQLAPLATIAVGDDRTPEDVRRGRIAFNAAKASSSGTFACASCHPDAHTDQLMWVIGAECDGCDQEEPRSTMPVRGLANTLPLHWDGTLGDPIGGPNGEIGVGASEPALDCSLANGPQECFRHLVDAALAGVMCEQPACAAGPSGLAGGLDVAERESMAVFLRSVAYPPARSRALDDAVTASARDGFADFFLDQGGNGGSQARSCADTTGGCHALPLGVSTNSVAVGAFEAPTMRGMTDRFLQFSGGFTAPQEFLDLAASFGGGFGAIPWSPADGLDEKVVFSAGFFAFNPAYNVLPDDLFQMFEEASTGTSGALGRMVTLDATTTGASHAAATGALLDALEAADARGVVNVYGDGVYAGTPVSVSYQADAGLWQVGPDALTRAELEQEAQGGALRATLTAHLPASHGQAGHPQPLLDVVTVGDGPGGDPDVPLLSGGGSSMTLVGVDVRGDARILVDGEADAGSVSCVAGGSFAPLCTSGRVQVHLAQVPPAGLHLLQVQNGDGPLSPELPFCVGSLAGDCL